MKDFLSFVESQPLVIFDGAMGTQLDKRGLMGRGRTNLDSPEAVLEIHREYAAAGSDALTTNTLTMNRIFIETHDVGVSVREVNEAGVRLAREVAGDRLFALGDMCSTGQLLEPYGEYTEDQFYRTFREQAEVLAEAGVDAFIVETMFDLREALIALKACKDVGSLPVIVSMAFATEVNGGRTIMGNSAEECTRELADSGVDVIGLNCGDLEPLQMARVVSILRSAASLPILAQPNAGKPKLIGAETVFDMGTEEFAAGMRECVRAGAKLIGGCCGTSPEHIRALAKDKDR